MISIIHPSRGRPGKSYQTIIDWLEKSNYETELIVVIDDNDDKGIDYYKLYGSVFPNDKCMARKGQVILTRSKSSIEAINTGARIATGNILIVVSDDTTCPKGWNFSIEQEVDGKTDWILKTQDGIQDYIITSPILDKIYYNRTGYIYHPNFQHLFCDTYLTCQADILGRKITSNLMFKHNHYSVNGTEPDELHKRNDATWKQGQETFIRLMNQFTLEERRRIKDQSMKNWLRNKGVQI